MNVAQFLIKLFACFLIILINRPLALAFGGGPNFNDKYAPFIFSWKGFFQSDDPILPIEVKKATSAVFLLYSPNGEFIIFNTQLQESNRSLRSRQDQESSPPLFSGQDKESNPPPHSVLDFFAEPWEPKARQQWGELVPDILTWIKFQLLVCIKQGINKCPVSSTPFVSSSFLLGNLNRIATNLHVVQNWIRAVLIHNPGTQPRHLILPLLILNKEHNLVIDSSKENESCRLDFFNIMYNYLWRDPFIIGEIKENAEFILSDFIEMSCSRQLGTTFLRLVDGKQPPKLLEWHYLLGYPQPTKFLKQAGGEDSPGKTLLVSLGVWDHERSSERNVDNKMVFSTPFASGSSGGPILNQKGEVVAILYGGKMTPGRDPKFLFITANALWLNYDALTYRWERMNFN